MRLHLQSLLLLSSQKKKRVNNAKQPSRILILDQPLKDVVCPVANAKGLSQEFELTYGGFTKVSRYPTALLDQAKSADAVEELGGAAFNTARVMGKLLPQDKISVEAAGVFGSPPRQQAKAKSLKTLAETKLSDARVKLIPLTDERREEGVCAILTDRSDSSRTMATYLGAAETLSDEAGKQLVQSPHGKRPDLVYASGFFLHSALRFGIGRILNLGKRFAVNLSSGFSVQAIGKENWISILQSASFVFGNKEEFEAFEKEMKDTAYGGLLAAIVRKRKPSGLSIPGRQLVMVMTDGPHPFVVASLHKTGKLSWEVQTPKRVKGIKDTIGAGDAFVGGFFAALKGAPPANQKALTKAIAWAKYAAEFILRQTGCNVVGLAPPHQH